MCDAAFNIEVILRDSERPELLVSVFAGRLDDDGQSLLVDWCRPLGYGRLWLPDSVVTLEADEGHHGGHAHTTCPSCRSQWEEDAYEFWLAVRGWGHYPLWCPLCGQGVPQWEVRP